MLVLVYYLGSDLYLIDPQVMELQTWQAIAISLASLAFGWLAYNTLCRVFVNANQTLLMVALFGLLVVVPVCLRVANGWADPLGYLSDVGLGGALVVLLYRRPVWLAVPVVLAWGVLSLASAELVAARDAPTPIPGPAQDRFACIANPLGCTLANISGPDMRQYAELTSSRRPSLSRIQQPSGAASTSGARSSGVFKVSGWATFRPCASARCLTGLGISFCPRPAGRSGGEPIGAAQKVPWRPSPAAKRAAPSSASGMRARPRCHSCCSAR